MTAIASFVFNDFQENAYVVYDETDACCIIDPGCLYGEEQDQLREFIEKKGLKPEVFLNTHCHLDHVFGNAFVHRTYGLPLQGHRAELPVLESSALVAKAYGLELEPSPEMSHFLNAGDIVKFGNTQFKVLFTPGHSPGSISLYCEKEGFVIVGDVLFRQSIGRTDLPGGDTETLFRSIQEQLFTLPDTTTVYSGHGPETTIGFEKANNPFFIHFANN